MSKPSYHDIAKMLDHSLLRPGTPDAALEEGIDEAVAADVASVCISPHYIRRLCERLRGTTIKSSTVIGFPHGAHTQSTKLHEAYEALQKGCDELDVVINLGKVKSGDFGYVEDEMEAIVSATHDAGKKVKIIFETCLLTDEEKIRLCQISSAIGVDWVKTSTGFGSAGATQADVQLMRKHCADEIEIKASGGVHTLGQVLEFLAAGATRIGTSKTKDILAETQGQ